METLPQNKFYRARVLEISDQKVSLKVLSGDQKDQLITVDKGEKVKEGDQVVITATEFRPGETPEFYIMDVYRLPALGFIVLLFWALAILVAGRRGFMAVFGLLLSLLVLMQLVVPGLVAGKSPYLITGLGVFLIASMALFLAHGFNKRTLVAWGSTLITVFLAFLVAELFVKLTALGGTASEDAFYLQSEFLSHLDFRRILIGAIVLGSLGLLDDVTTAQTATIDELKKANPQFSFHQLYRSGISVGKEHVVSLINTLALAYFGASFSLFFLFYLGKGQPLWVLLNNQSIVEELVRTLVGSATLILAVPIATALAAYVYAKETPKIRI